MIHLAVTAALLGVTFVVANRFGSPAALTFAFLTLTCVESGSLLQLTHTNLLVGTTLAAPDLEVHAYHLVILASLFLIPDILRRRNVSFPLLLVPLGLLAIAVAQANLTVLVSAGIVQWAFAALAWPLGAWVAEQRRIGRLDDRMFVLAVLTPVAANVAAVALQLFGGRAVSSIALGSGSLERVSGLEGHSGNLGKVLLLLLILLLPLTTSRDAVSRRLATTGIVFIVIVTGLTYSRANMLGVGAAILIWFVMQPGASIARRVGLPVVAAACALPFVNTLLLRNNYDPTGGSRPTLTAAAWNQIHQTLMWGIGPNNYQNRVGVDSPISAVLPVHNTFLLTLAEAGLVMSIVIAYPLVRMVLRCLTNVRGAGIGRSQAVAFIATLPGLAVIALTGHGLVTDHIMLLLFFILGFCFRTAASDMRAPEPVTADVVPRRGAETEALPLRTRTRIREVEPAADRVSALAAAESRASARALTPAAPATPTSDDFRRRVLEPVERGRR